MKIQRFHAWSVNASHKIQFPQDRERVRQELYDHMVDHCEMLTARGVSQEEAELQTVEAMGDAFEIAPQLAAIHDPFWGYFLRFTRIALILLLCVCLWPIGEHLYEVYRPVNYVFDQDSSWNTKITKLSQWEQDDSFSTDTARYAVTEASIWSREYDDGDGQNKTMFHLDFRVVQTNFLPWGFEPNYYSGPHSPAGWFWAEDNLGNYYYSYMERDPDYPSDERCLQIMGRQTGLFTYTHEIWINDFPQEDVTWLKLHYDRDGRDYALHIDLTGGGDK